MNVKAAAIAGKVLLLVLVAHAVVFADLPQYQNKGMGYRVVLYPLGAVAVPAIWLVGRRMRDSTFPWAIDGCVTAPFLLDMAGNAANLYDTVSWWDDVMHVATWVPWVVAFGLVIADHVPSRWQLAGLVIGFGAVTHIAWEIAEYVTFVQSHPTESLSAYADTINDLAGSLVGSVVGAALVARATREREAAT